MSIQAIETRYAGCRFRSRLEARWAVFFDTLGISWEYEPQGFDLSGSKYLPDFWLPQCDSYAEVKGSNSLADDAYRAMLSEAIDFNNSPLSQGLLLLGPHPDVSEASAVLHSRLAWHEGVVHHLVEFTPWGIHTYTGIGGVDECVTAPDWPPRATWDAQVLRVEHKGRGFWRLPLKREKAYVAARSARFEHGESG